MNTHLFSKLPLALTVFSAALCLNCVEVMRQKCERTKTKKREDFLNKDSGLCVRETRGRETAHCTYSHTHTHTTCTHTLTACSLRHGRHGGLTHIRLEHRAGPGPRTRYHGSLSPHKPRPPPPSEFISKKEVFTPWWLSRWKLGSLSHSLSTTS